MKYKVGFRLEYFNGTYNIYYISFETKGKGKKVLRSHIKKYIEDYYKEQNHIVNINIISIERFENLNFNNVWNKEDFKKFKLKQYEKNYEVNK